MTIKNLFGTAPDQVPLNRDLGTLAFQNDDAVNIKGTLTTTKTNKAIIDELTHDTSIVTPPTVLMNFTSGTPTIDNRVSFTRASSATYIGADGYIKTAAINEPRFEYDPITKTCNGLLMEETRTNLALYSSTLSSFAVGAASLINGATNAPNNTNEASKLVESVDPSTHNTRFLVNITNGNRVVTSFYVKAAERSKFYLCLAVGTSTLVSEFSTVYFDLATGTIGASTTGTLNIGAPEYQTITYVGNGWYRCSMACVINATTARTWVLLADNSGSYSYTGDGTSGLYLWGAQIEVGNYITSYIPTTSATVTRQTDVAYIPTESSWFNAAEGTIFCEARTVNAGKGEIMRLISLNDGTTTNRIESYVSTSSANAFPTLVSSTTNASGSSSFTNINTQPIKTAYAYKADNFAMIADGSSTPDTDTAGAIPVVNRLSFGHSYVSSSSLNGYVRKIAYYPVRLSNNELVEITRI